MTSDNVKAILLAGFGIAVVATVWKLYHKAGQMGTDLVTAAGQIEKDLVQGITSMGNTVGAMADQVKAGINSTTDALGLTNSTDNGYQMPAGYGATLLPFKRWPQSAIDGINAANRLRGIKRTWKFEGDFAGWKVYSDGTIISPDGYYLRDLIAAGDVSATQANFAFSEIPDNFSGLTFDQTRYQWQTAQE
ncbi:hypothetical protein [uncultured Dechloromonas sp.]|uniref:hypothetical protein n=1 Tax=uncultured Dechloromonas sp. TaxID=171719 RepID=UPI0025DD6965|nr:hypothetical protein [uncultured Dechloromonas sp.]